VEGSGSGSDGRKKRTATACRGRPGEVEQIVVMGAAGTVEPRRAMRSARAAQAAGRVLPSQAVALGAHDRAHPGAQRSGELVNGR